MSRSCFPWPARDRVSRGVCVKDWEAIKFSDEETRTWKQLKVIFYVVYRTSLGRKGDRKGWCLCVCVCGGHFNMGSLKNCREETVI